MAGAIATCTAGPTLRFAADVTLRQVDAACAELSRAVHPVKLSDGGEIVWTGGEGRRFVRFSTQHWSSDPAHRVFARDDVVTTTLKASEHAPAFTLPEVRRIFEVLARTLPMTVSNMPRACHLVHTRDDLDDMLM